jgi:hypothetical protein
MGWRLFPAESGRGRRFRCWGCAIAAPVPTSEPDRLTAGDTWTWSRAFPDYPASEYTISYAIAGATALSWDAAYAVVSGDGVVITIPATATADLVPGTYRWVAYATLSSTRYTADSGVFTVEPNLAVFADGEALTHNERMLALVEAALEERLTGVSAGGRGTVENYAVEGRQVSLIPTEQLSILLGKYRRAVSRERNPDQANPQMLVRFVRP